MKISNCVLLCLFLNFGFAHDANKAFYKITQKEEVVEVTAEFPWILRNALLKEYPELENSKNQQDFDTAFFNYIKNNFKISTGESSLKLLSVVKRESDGHSHQNNYIFTFKGIGFNTIKNTIMFAISSLHKNYHQLQLKGKQQEFVTTSRDPNFRLDTNSKDNSTANIQSVNLDEKEKHSHGNIEYTHEQMEAEQITNYYYYVPAMLIIGFLFLEYYNKNRFL